MRFVHSGCKTKTFLGLMALALTLPAMAAEEETKESRDRRMGWWREARFGMFVHWGLYSTAAGRWNGEPIGGLSSWSLHTLKIPLSEYTPLTERFNPVRFDADALVLLAKRAGMKYIVITAKHHEGFSLFDSQDSDFDVMATPFRRDIMKELAESCHRHGMRLGWYYSILDWHHPDYLPRRPGDARPTDGADFGRYVTFMKKQLRELLTKYGKVDVIWFDGEWDPTWTDRDGWDLDAYVRGLQSEILVNNRVGKGRQGMAGMNKPGRYPGDFGTPEQEIPPTGLPGMDWETCMTMNDTWGFKQNDHHWKSTTTLLHMLVDCASKGGNFLLNVGPTPEGTIPKASVERLNAMGQWMRLNGQSIHGTGPSPFPAPLVWGRATCRMLPEGNTRLYLHVFTWPSSGKLEVPGLRNRVRSASLLADPSRTALAIARVGDTLTISLPSKAPDANDSVVVLDLVGPPDVKASSRETPGK